MLITQLLNDGKRLIGRQIRAAHEVGLCEALIAAEVCDEKGALFGVAGPQFLNVLKRLQMPAANLLGDRLQHLPASDRQGRRRAPQDERLAPRRRRRLLKEDLRQSPAARLDDIAVEE